MQLYIAALLLSSKMILESTWRSLKEFWKYWELSRDARYPAGYYIYYNALKQWVASVIKHQSKMPEDAAGMMVVGGGHE